MAATHRPAGIPALERRELLRAALGRMRRVTGLPVAFGGEVSPGGRGVRLTEFAGTWTDALPNLVVSAGNGLGGRVLLAARPGSVDDYAADSRISHEYDKQVTAEGLRAIAAVPVLVGESVFSVLYGGVREPQPLGGWVLAAMNQIAVGVGVELTVRSEVERRLAELETAAIIRSAREAPAAPGWEDVREAHAELRSIAQEITDAALRRRLQLVCDRLTRPRGRPARGNPLSPRELDVLALVAVGCGNAEVGRRLGLRSETVKSYLRNAMRKLGTHGRTETVVAARRAGFLP
ncbi:MULTISPECIES: LuxR C-terminal-related transcriptional regulator [unclassified Frankia]|uniref:LuxR C-terminal-related transcriptional regulator n=1 Tax=unclassified Frankia TaxID=2632575 RepID=UPI002AD57FAE|nr:MULTISPECIES: LuxR C-terminal-related transcriptional regulator [unclassified Frankia]